MDACGFANQTASVAIICIATAQTRTQKRSFAMAKRTNNKAAPASPVDVAVEAAADIASTSPVRKTVAPKSTAAKKVASAATVPVTFERIAERAYLIAESGYGGSQDDNWFRAERELKGGV